MLEGIIFGETSNETYMFWFMLADAYLKTERPSWDTMDKWAECFVNGLRLMPDELREKTQQEALNEFTNKLTPDMLKEERILRYINAITDA